MKTNAARTQENKSQAAANRGSEQRSSRESTFLFEDNRSEALKLRKLQKTMNNSPRSMKTAQLKGFIKSNLSSQPILNKSNKSRRAAYSVDQSTSGEKQGQGSVDNRPRPASGGLPSAPNGIVDRSKFTQSHAPSPVLFADMLYSTTFHHPSFREPMRFNFPAFFNELICFSTARVEIFNSSESSRIVIVGVF